LRQSEQRLRDLSTKLLTAQEEERRRIAREVHDSIGSYLTGVKIRLENAVRAAQRGETQATELQTLVEMIRHVMRESRRIMTDLRPAVLDDHEIELTLGWLCERFEELYPAIRIEANIDLKENDLSEEMRVVIFRVIQEALSNVGNHSRSPAVRVSLRRGEDGIVLRVEDDGVGFLLEAAARKGLGLTSMRERVELTRGTFNIDSAPGRGTTVRALWQE
jgi:signal transduction histidine kinase